MKNFILTLLLAIATTTIVCYAGTIYDDARQAGIAQYNSGNYHAAVKQFIALQNIAPVNNDLASWILKCDNRIIEHRNKKVIKSKSLKKTLLLTDTKKSIKSNEDSTQYKLEEIYDSIGNYFYGVALVQKNGMYGYIDKQRKQVVAPIYEDVCLVGWPVMSWEEDHFVFCEKGDWCGKAIPVKKNGRWGYVDKSGTEIIPCIYDAVITRIEKSDSIIPICKNGKYGYIDISGKEITAMNYDFAGKFTNGIAPVVKEGKLGFINNNGELVIDYLYDPVYEYSDSFAYLQTRYYFSEDVLPVRLGGKWGMIDYNGNTIIPYEFDELVNGIVIPKEKQYFEFRKNGELFYVFNKKVYYNFSDMKSAWKRLSKS